MLFWLIVTLKLHGNANIQGRRHVTAASLPVQDYFILWWQEDVAARHIWDPRRQFEPDSLWNRHCRVVISSDWGTCGEHGAQKVQISHFLLLGVQSVTTSNVFCKILPVFLVHASKWLFSQKTNIVWVPEFGSKLRVSLNTTCLMFL